VAELEGLVQSTDPAAVRGVFRRFIPEYQPAPARPPSVAPSASAASDVPPSPAKLTPVKPLQPTEAHT
jgi:hypothetical protein